MSDLESDGADLTEEELAAKFAEQLAKTPVHDIMLQSLATLIDAAGIRIGYGPVGEEGKDLAQAKQAIEAASALLEVTERELGEQMAGPFREPVRVLKMAYVQASGSGAAPAEGQTATETTASEAAPPPSGASHPDEPDRASRLWVPPGTRPND